VFSISHGFSESSTEGYQLLRSSLTAAVRMIDPQSLCPNGPFLNPPFLESIELPVGIGL
jgi:hypothetical protein